MNKIRVVVKRVDDIYGEVHEIENTLESLQRIVGGYIETATFGEDWCVICDEEGRLKGKPYNCSVGGIGFVGDIVFVGVDGDEFCDVPENFLGL